jgi:hypothetical protein
MKLPTGVNPAHCTTTDKTRYVLEGVQFKDGLAVATTGRVLFACKAEKETTDANRPALVPKRAMLKAFPKGKHNTTAIPGLTINPIEEGHHATVTVLDKNQDETTTREIDGTFPAWEHVVEDPEDYTIQVSLNLDLLTLIAKSFGHSALTLHMSKNGFREHGHNNAMFVTCQNSPDAFAIIMPMMGDGEKPAKHPLIVKAHARRLALEAAKKAELETPTTTPQ